MGGGKNNINDTFWSSYEYKKHQPYIGPDKLRKPKRHLTNIEVNFRPILPI